MNSRFSYQSWDIHYRDEGPAGLRSSPSPGSFRHTASCPLVLVHGFAEDGRIWDGQIQALKTNNRLIIPDLPGSGRSSPLRASVTIDQLAESLKALLDHEGIESCVIIGHSMGGYCALAIAEKYPAMIKGFGLFHSTAFPDTAEKKEARRKGIEFIRSNGAAPFVRQSILNLFSERFRRDRQDIVEGLIRQYTRSDGESLIHYYEAMMERPDRSAVLQQSAVPVFFLAGGQDRAVPIADSLRQCHLPSISHLTILEEVAHLGMVEEDRRCNETLDSYLRFTFGI
jgi:pimeloyl-ACP methyl ester carboxylesterase